MNKTLLKQEPGPISQPTQRIEHLSRLVEVSKSDAVQLGLEPLLQQIVDTATELVNAEMGGLLVLDEDEQRCQFFKVSGWPHEPRGFLRGQCSQVDIW